MLAGLVIGISVRRGTWAAPKYTDRGRDESIYVPAYLENHPVGIKIELFFHFPNENHKREVGMKCTKRKGI